MERFESNPDTPTPKQVSNVFDTVLAGESLLGKLDKDSSHDINHKVVSEDDLKKATNDQTLSPSERRTAQQLLLMEEDLHYQKAGLLPSAPVVFDGSKTSSSKPDMHEITSGDLDQFEFYAVKLMGAQSAGLNADTLATDLLQKYGQPGGNTDTLSHLTISPLDVDRALDKLNSEPFTSMANVEIVGLTALKEQMKDSKDNTLKSDGKQSGESDDLLKSLSHPDLHVDHSFVQSAVDKELWSGPTARAFNHTAGILFPQYASDPALTGREQVAAEVKAQAVP
jgi:hypothetical protein